MMTESERDEMIEKCADAIWDKARLHAVSTRPPRLPMELSDVVWAVAAVLTGLFDENLTALDAGLREVNANIITAVRAAKAVSAAPPAVAPAAPSKVKP